MNKLIEGVANAKDELDRDGVIQRFEFTFESFWKLLKLILQYEGFDCKSPRSCIKEAFKRDIIVDSELFLDMMLDRNLSSHVYNEETSIEIFERIKGQYADKLLEADKKLEPYIEEH